jgi:hypothetical protein
MEEEGLCVDDEDFAGVATGDPPQCPWHGGFLPSWLLLAVFFSFFFPPSDSPLVSSTTFFFQSFT